MQGADGDSNFTGRESRLEFPWPSPLRKAGTSWYLRVCIQYFDPLGRNEEVHLSHWLRLAFRSLRRKYAKKKFYYIILAQRHRKRLAHTLGYQDTVTRMATQG